jgi:hypothetical protein
VRQRLEQKVLVPEMIPELTFELREDAFLFSFSQDIPYYEANG